MHSLALCILAAFCFTGNVNTRYGQLAQKEMNAHSDEMCRKYGFEVAGTGGSFTTDIRSVYLMYVCKQHLSLQQARRLYVSVVEDLVTRLNANRNIRPFLHEYPITGKNIEIDLSFENRDGTSFKNNEVAFISNMDGKGIVYYVSQEGSDRIEILHRESYEEALRIVFSERNPPGIIKE